VGGNDETISEVAIPHRHAPEGAEKSEDGA